MSRSSNGHQVESQDLSKLKIDRDVKTRRFRSRKKWVFLGIAVLLSVAAAVLYFTGILSPAVSVEVVTVSQLYPSQTLSRLTASGYVVAQRKAAVASKITGRLVELGVEEGSRVKKGQVIARLENDDAVAARDQAEANLKASLAGLEEAKAQQEEASRTFERYRKLVTGGYIARSEYDTAEARFLSAQASVAAAEAAVRANRAALRGAVVNLEYALIKSPFDAVVLTKNADIGDIVTPIGAAAEAKAAVVTIADLDSLQVEADVSETNLSLITGDQPCEIVLDALPDTRFPGVVHAIVPTVDRTKATILVKVRFLEKDGRILPEMRAKVTFLTRPLKEGEQEPRTVINPAALVRKGGKITVFVIRGNRVSEFPLQSGRALGEMVEVLDGVKAGDRVVIRPPKRLKDGARIKIVEK